jgi:hypothetical protein
MNGQPTADIAKAYNLTRQRIFQIRKNHDLSVQDFRNPDFVFERLLEGTASPLRKRLSIPSHRERIRQSLNS